MLDFVINEQELAALYGLSHIQQLTYLRAIRPYMNVKTGIVGIERGISYQSIAEQLYIEPHQGIRSVTISRAQLRRAIAGLERAGLIKADSEGYHLILKCPLATRDYYVSKKAVTNPSRQVVTFENSKVLEKTDFLADHHEKADTVKSAKAVIPHKENNYLYLSQQFELFWSHFPNKKSKQRAWEVFQQLSPDQQLLKKIITSLDSQVTHREEQLLHGNWAPPWKYPANWLTQECWNDELVTIDKQESSYAKRTPNNAKKSSSEVFWDSCGDTNFDFDEPGTESTTKSNVIRLSKA